MAGTYVGPMTEALIAYEGNMVSTDLSPHERWRKQYAVTAAVPCFGDQCGARVLGIVMKEMFPLDNPKPRITPCGDCKHVEQLCTP